MSRIGNKPIAIPQEVKVEINDKSVCVQGPKGKSNLTLHNRISAHVKDGQLRVTRLTDAKLDKSLHGLSRALIFNMIQGVTQGYVKELEIQGIGYKALVQGATLTLQLGFSHPVIFQIPEGIQIEAPKHTHIIVRGIDKEKVGEITAEIRAVCPPEPYKGKGIRYKGEYVKKKVGKAQATGGGK